MLSDPQRPPNTRRPSLRDVAKAADVSVSTASRVFSNAQHPVSELTRARVLASAERLDFLPNRLARGLVTSRSQVVGAIVHDISDPYFGDIVRGLEDGLSPHDYRLLVASTDRDPQKELDYLKALISQQVDGIVLASSSIADQEYETTISDIIARYRHQGGAVIVLSEHVVHAPRVLFDNQSAAAAVVEHLIDLGHRRIAHISGHQHLAISRVRLQGYRDALSHKGLPFDPTLVVYGKYTIEGGRAAALELRKNGTFSAIFASSDPMAIGATRGLLDEGVEVPDEVSIAGFGDIILAPYGPVPLTTFSVPTRKMGQQASRMMLAQIRGLEAPDTPVEGRLVRRSSVAEVTKDSPATKWPQ